MSAFSAVFRPVAQSNPLINKSQTKLTQVATCFRAGFLLGLLFDPEDEGDMFLQNVI
jgi:hypothetical protein